MSDKNSSTLAVGLVAMVLFVSMGGIYSVGYFMASIRTTNRSRGGTCRVYHNSWVAMFFMPGTFVESAATGRQVVPAWPTPQP